MPAKYLARQPVATETSRTARKSSKANERQGEQR
jgi:hypothetical protein